MMTPRSGIPELLAPAGSREAFEAAVAAGADAVYLSGRRFGARAFADNFDDDALAKTIRDAHARGVRVYVTVNTLILDDELPAVASHLVALFRMGVDAVLVQDMGVIRLAREIVPELPLHASTQMTIHSAEGVRYAARQGIRRIVLARELSREEVRDVTASAAAIGVETEIFAHGALCMGYSGQCLLSSVIVGRSGNRGRCAQPCRRLYAPVIGETDNVGCILQDRTAEEQASYLLSPRDLAIYPRLPEIPPVAAVKIEGRMKSPEYVATITSLYRQALDAIADGTFSPEEDDLLPAYYSFNRGFTRGHLFGALGPTFLSEERPHHRGVSFGIVQWYDRMRSEAVIGDLRGAKPEIGDGIVFLYGGEEDVGCEIRQTVRERDGRVRIPVPSPVRRGAVAAINKRASVERAAADLIASYHHGGGKEIPVITSVDLESDHLRLSGLITLPGGDRVTISAESESPMAAAVNKPLATHTILDLLHRTGDTQFVLEIEAVEYEGDRFLPIREITALRRRFLDEASDAMIRAQEPDQQTILDAEARLSDYLKREIPQQGRERVQSPASVAVYAGTLQQAEGAIRGGCNRIYYEPDLSLSSCGGRIVTDPGGWQRAVLDEFRQLIELSSGDNIAIFWKFSDIPGKQFLDCALSILPEAVSIGIRGVMAGSPGIAEAVHTIAPGIEIAGSSALNITNHDAFQEVSDLFGSIALSRELRLIDLVTIGSRVDGSVEFFVQGLVPAMITKQCIARGRHPCPSGAEKRLIAIRDSTGKAFPVRVDCECRTIISNAVETSLIDHLPAIIDAGAAVLAIELRGRTKTYAETVCRAYRDALNGGDITRLKEEIKNVSWGGITTGPFLKRDLA